MKIVRKWRSKGHGVHSPFAFDLIRNVLCSSHEYYAFSDIEKSLADIGKRDRKTVAFNRLSFRLAHRFSIYNVLEINAENEINSLFIIAARKNAHNTCVKTGELAKILGENRSFNAIFVYTNNGELPIVDTLLSLSHNDTFWVVHQINNKQGKQFWRSILADERIRMTFDVKNTGVAFLCPEYSKLNYRV